MSRLEELVLRQRAGILDEQHRMAMEQAAASSAREAGTTERRLGGMKSLTTLGAIGGGLLAAPLTGGTSLAATLAILAGTSAGGAALGELARQEIVRRPEEGLAIGEIGKEAAVSGALSAGTLGLGKAFQAGRAGLGVKEALAMTSDDITRAAQAATASRQAAKETTKSAFKTIAKNIDESSSGFGIGTPMGGGRVLDADDADDLLRFAREGSKQYVPQGIPAGTRVSQARAAAEVKKAVTNSLDDTLDDINRALASSDKSALKASIKQAADVDEAITGTTKTLDKFLGNIDDTKDLKALEALRRRADKLAFTQTGAGKTSAARQAGIVREQIDDFITAIPDEQFANYKAIKADWRRANDLLRLTSKGTPGAKAAIGSPLLGARIPQTGIASRLASRVAGTGGGAGTGLGAALRGAAAQTGAALTPTTIPTAATLPQLLSQMAKGQAGTPAAAEQQLQTQETGDTLGAQFTPKPTGLAAKLADPAVQQQLLLADLLDPESGGKNVSTLKAIFELSAPQTAVDPYQALTVGERTALNDIQAAEGLVDQLERDVAAVGLGTGVGRFVEGAKDFLGAKLQTNPEAAAFEQSRGALATLLIRAIGEKGTLAEGDVKRAVNLVPRITDNQETAARKLAALRGIFAQRKTTLLETATRAEGQGTTDLQSALQGAGVQF